MLPISDKLVSMLQAQMAHEIGNSHLYQQIASWASCKGLKGIASYFSTQASGEMEHFGWIKDILNDANAPIIIPTVEQRPSGFESCEQIAQLYLETESDTSDRLEAISKESDAEYDIGVQDLMQRMLREQVEEIGSSDRFINLVQLSNGDLIKLDLALR